MGCDGLFAIGSAGHVESIVLPQKGYFFNGKVHHVVTIVTFKVPMMGERTWAFINAHWGNEMAKKKTHTRLALADMVELICKYNVRFVVGDFNMYAYTLPSALFDAGVESHLLAVHAESKLGDRAPGGLIPTARELYFDSCVIVAIGGLKYNPKVNLLITHEIMGAQCQPKGSW